MDSLGQNILLDSQFPFYSEGSKVSKVVDWGIKYRGSSFCLTGPTLAENSLCACSYVCSVLL